MKIGVRVQGPGFRPKNRLFGVVLLAAITACTSNSELSAPPTPTNITSGFRGPVLGGSGTGEESESCSEEGGCVQNDDEPVEMDSAPLTLVQQRVGNFNIGIPEGYAPITLDDGILIRVVSPELLGGFTVSLREINAAQLPDLLEHFGQPDFEEGTSIQHLTLTGNVLPTGDYGVIVLLSAGDGRQIFVEAFAASPAYWEAFRATFDAMLESLTL